MSTFVLKLIALIAMLIDHIAEVFGWEGWDLLPVNASFLRYIGRISYPIFAFFIVEGWKNTRSKEKYFSRLALFAVISQIPFTMAFYVPNHTITTGSTNAFTFRVMPAFFLIALAAVISYWYFALDKKLGSSLFVLAAAAILPAFLLKVNYIWILVTDNLNVLYTLMLGLVMLFAIEKFKDRSLRAAEYLWLCIIVGLLLLSYGANADYGIGLMGVILIAALYFTQKSRLLQSGVIAVWGVVLYGLMIGNWKNAAAVLVPSLLILTYYPKKRVNGAAAKWLFYLFYPIHLFLIGMVNVFLKG